MQKTSWNQNLYGFFPTNKVGSDFFCHQSFHLIRNQSSVLFAWLVHFIAPVPLDLLSVSLVVVYGRSFTEEN